MGLIILILIPFVIGIVTGIVEHSKISTADTIAFIFYIILIGCCIYEGVAESFWGAVGFFFLFGIPFYVGYKITGLEDTVIHRGSRKYSLKCKDCGCTNLEILSEDEDMVTYRCRKCGQIVITELRR
ncbi:MAG: hypothetical protein IJV08_02905 [Bacteroidaceae bacterium]|nr:hypothetical protein [Bacteroidaceae bacterium]